MHRFAAWLRRRVPEPHPGIVEIVAWCDGKSNPLDARRIALHLVSCARCRMHVELQYEGRRKLLVSPPEPLRSGRRRPLAFVGTDFNQRLAGAVTRYFGTRAAGQIEGRAANDLFNTFLGKRATDALIKVIDLDRMAAS